jgi:7,8-dihydropterin-6-yl-methyl-4-(beta-D-ribofuranosyl)aminobenzene 5'-phosphate synthase
VPAPVYTPTLYTGYGNMERPRPLGTENAISILYDNRRAEPGVIPAWGFSCLISFSEGDILFDTGGDPSILGHNMEAMHVHSKDIGHIILSHEHGDHTGGLSGLLGASPAPTLYFPQSFPRRFREAVRYTGANGVAINGFTEIRPAVYTTGELGRGLKEQSLILRTVEGLIIITGCAHPGIVEITEAVVRRLEERVYLLMGGFHLMGKSPAALTDIAHGLDALNVERISPCHCSGDTTIDFFEHQYGRNFIPGGVGARIPIPEPLK